MDVKFLKQNRKYIRAEITRLHNSVKDNIASFSHEHKLQTIARLESLQGDIKDFDLKIASSLFAEGVGEDVIKAEYDTSAEYANKLIATLTLLKSSLTPVTGSALREDTHYNKLKLPRLPLPEYGHKEGEDLNKFFTNFELIIDKYSLSSFEKFVFLQKQLSNEPLTLIKSLETGRQDYESAKELLEKAFASPLTQKYDAIRRLSEIKLRYNDDPYEFIGKMRMLTDSFKSLKIDANDVLQFFIWHGMNDRLQAQFVNITKCNKPSLTEINTHIFDATERYLEISKSVRHKKERDSKPKDSNLDSDKSLSASFGANVSSTSNDKAKRSQFCSLCTGKGQRVTTHSTFNCHAYPSPSSKREKLKELNGCIRCGNLSHETKSCNFRFKKKCSNCMKFHFSYLCIANNSDKASSKPDLNSDRNSESKVKGNSNATTGNGKEVSTGLLSVGGNSLNFLAHYGEDAIVPTFSFVSNEVVRAMRDSGCQPSFVTERLAKMLNLKVIQSNFSLTVHGFNSSERYTTDIVELKVNDSLIKAICIPSIKINLDLPGLSKVVEEFSKKGYEFADKYLLSGDNKIADLDMILGNNDSQLLPQQEVKFGKDPSSVYSSTPYGIMLMGSIDRYLVNLSNLPDLTVVDSASSVNSELDLSDNAIDFSEHFDLYCNVDSPDLLEVNSQNVVLNERGQIDEVLLQKATEAISDEQYANVLNYDKITYEENSVESNRKLTDFVLNSTTRSTDGRLIMPLLWNN